MDYEPNIRLINSHAKGNGRTNDLNPVIDERFLVVISFFLWKACMICNCFNALRYELIS